MHNYTGGDTQAEIQERRQGRRDTREEETLKKKKIATQSRAGAKGATLSRNSKEVEEEA